MTRVLKTSVMLPVLLASLALGGVVQQQSAEPWDFAPNMSASVSPGYQAVTELQTVVTSITITDKDTFHRVPNDLYFQVAPGMPDVITTLNSADSADPQELLTVNGYNDGTWNLTHTHKALDLPQEESYHIYVDNYKIEDNHSAYAVLKDPTLYLSTQVRVNPAP